MRKRIAIVDYGVGNHASLSNSLVKCGFSISVTRSLEILDSADLVLLPGVGSFATACNELSNTGLYSYLKTETEKKPILGICLGMQLLCDSSEEGGDWLGLGIIPGRIQAIEGSRNHIGWNQIKVDCNNEFFNEFNNYEFYFNHKYQYSGDKKFVYAEAFHGKSIPAIIRHKNALGIQFHPEKSQTAGINFLKKIIFEMIND